MQQLLSAFTRFHLSWQLLLTGDAVPAPPAAITNERTGLSLARMNDKQP